MNGFEFLKKDITDLGGYLLSFIQDGGKSAYKINAQINPVTGVEGMSGLRYRNLEGEGEMLVGILLGGAGFGLKRSLKTSSEVKTRFDYFSPQGKFTFSSDRECLKVLIVDSYEMDLTCPILNHFYNFLSLEYKKAQEGHLEMKLAHWVEKFLLQVSKEKKHSLFLKNLAQDPAIIKIYQQIQLVEKDPVLTWSERQGVFKKLILSRGVILKTKIRAHRLFSVRTKIHILLKDVHSFLIRFLSRPMSNTKGILYHLTVGKMIWFFQTVRNNLGYSIALAIYGPFTYYFITMPMNPHAMQAVGKVRSTYLEVKSSLSKILDDSEKLFFSASVSKAPSTAETPTSGVKEAVKQDEITLRSSAPLLAGLTPNGPLPVVEDKTFSSYLISPSLVASNSSTPLVLELGGGVVEKVVPTYLNMLVSTDVPTVDKISWEERMGQFKQMQIAYEENIEFASRMGRLEQLETQFNFPLQVEAAWEEMERYNSAIFSIREKNPNLSARMKQFLFNEVNRTHQLQLYLWDRMGRFILDQIYVMLDQDREQKRNNYYVGRAFVFMQEMTKILSWRYEKLKTPVGFEKIKTLADFYQKNRTETGKVLKNLAANSDLFKQKNLLDTVEFRSYMKRQWEILYLQNAKAEEASNMGLNMYIWSVRNTVWILQSFFSAKKEELALLIKKDSSFESLTPEESLSREKISLLFETLFHNLTLEYVGIREEMMKRIGKDIESHQRMTVLENLKESLIDREKLDGQVMAENKTGNKNL